MKQFFLGSMALLMMASCAPKHYRLVSVDRSRIIVDSRYDQNPDQKAAEYLAPFKRVNDSIMGPVMGVIAHNMHPQRPESDLSNLLADILVWAAKDYNEEPVLGIYNMGGIRADLTKGEVTYGDLLDVAPFENKICFITLTGESLLKVFGQMAKKGGEGVSRGLELVIEGPEGKGKVKSVRLHGKEIDPKAEYRIATINYLIEGNDGMPSLREGTNVVAPDAASNNTRYLIMNYFRDKHAKGEVVDSKVEGRIVRVDN